MRAFLFALFVVDMAAASSSSVAIDSPCRGLLAMDGEDNSAFEALCMVRGTFGIISAPYLWAAGVHHMHKGVHNIEQLFKVDPVSHEKIVRKAAELQSTHGGLYGGSHQLQGVELSWASCMRSSLCNVTTRNESGTSIAKRAYPWHACGSLNRFGA
jgi:hypothetical protein